MPVAHNGLWTDKKVIKKCYLTLKTQESTDAGPFFFWAITDTVDLGEW